MVSKYENDSKNSGQRVGQDYRICVFKYKIIHTSLQEEEDNDCAKTL